MSNKNKHKRIEWQKCPNCTKKFGSLRGLHIHKTRQSHWFEVKPKPPEPVRKQCNFKDLVKGTQWGRKYTEEEKKSPSDNDIIMGLLSLIVEKLDDLIHEVKRPR